MSKQTDYTPEEWKTISAAPVLAGLLVSVSDMSGPIGVVKEAMAVVKAVTESAATTSNELIKTLAEQIKARGESPRRLNCLPTGKVFMPRSLTVASGRRR